ncbi:MAG: nucleotide exchange factor GrpE [Bacteroidales bacterium]|nr:nucleotide exchange factor GrpE [Bacteroidales bacterium]MDY0142668.1 nucleotide exchange factor GrpE [Bacteroidales bacterium]
MKKNNDEITEIQENIGNIENIDDAENIENTDNSTSKKPTVKKAKKSKSKTAEDKLKDENMALNEAHGELKDKYLRLIAEYDNYRKRTLKEKVDLREQTKSALMFDFLDIVDDVDRAIVHIDDVKDIDATIDGVKLINSKFRDFLKSQGVEEIDAMDEDFDTDLHEAVTKFLVQDEDKKGKVIDIVQKGYKINDKVIRFAKVVVGE